MTTDPSPAPCGPSPLILLSSFSLVNFSTNSLDGVSNFNRKSYPQLSTLSGGYSRASCDVGFEEVGSVDVEEDEGTKGIDNRGPF